MEARVDNWKKPEFSKKIKCKKCQEFFLPLPGDIMIICVSQYKKINWMPKKIYFQLIKLDFYLEGEKFKETTYSYFAIEFCTRQEPTGEIDIFRSKKLKKRGFSANDHKINYFAVIHTKRHRNSQKVSCSMDQ